MTSDALLKLKDARDAVVTRVIRLSANRRRPVLVAIDGRSGAGKSVLGSMVAGALGAALVQSDDFYASDILDDAWDVLSPRERASKVIDWRRLRTEALEPLLH